MLFNRIKVHGYFMEYDSERAGGFEPLRLVPKDRQIVLGLVTTKTGRLEAKDAIKRRIEEAAKYISLDQLCLSPQCGFASTEEGNTLGGGRAMGQATDDRRGGGGSVGLKTISVRSRASGNLGVTSTGCPAFRRADERKRERMPGIVQNKVAIVTGGGRGIGRAVAELMAKEGARVVVCDIGASLTGSGSDAGPAQETVAAIKKAGGEAIASTLSITDPKNAEAIVKAAIDAFGRVDILVNNAGILRDVIFHKMS